LEEVKEKEYFVADKMKKIFEKNLEVDSLKNKSVGHQNM